MPSIAEVGVQSVSTGRDCDTPSWESAVEEIGGLDESAGPGVATIELLREDEDVFAAAMPKPATANTTTRLRADAALRRLWRRATFLNAVIVGGEVIGDPVA